MLIAAFVATVVAGYLGSAIFYSWNWPEAGPVFSIAVMGCFILYALRHPKEKE